MLKLRRVRILLAGVALVVACFPVTVRAAGTDDDVTRPCGTYDIQKLGEHFRVTVETRKVSTGHYEVAITADASQGEKDPRKPFPREQLRLTVLDGKGGTELETPVLWSKGKARFADGGGEPRATLLVAPKLAKRLVLMTPAGAETLFTPPGHVVIVGFRSLAE